MVNLMDRKNYFFALSTAIILPGVVSLILFGLKLGIDFTGGTILEYKIPKAENGEAVKLLLAKQKVELFTITAQQNHIYEMKTKNLESQQISQVKQDLEAQFGTVEEIRVESIGPVIGSETTRNAIIGVVLASVAIVIYLALAFRKVPKPASSWRFGLAAVAALLHDVLLVLGVFSILGHFWQVEIDILFVSAILTIIGFSVHDTIVVFDRIRENLHKILAKNFRQIANISVAQTMVRSLNTSLTVVLVLVALLLFGGATIKWFVVSLLVGIVSGTYSSIFNATALLVLWEEKLGH